MSKTKWVCNVCNVNDVCTVKLDSEYTPRCCVAASTGHCNWVKAPKKIKKEKKPLIIHKFPTVMFNGKVYVATPYIENADKEQIARCGDCDLRGDICHIHFRANMCGSREAKTEIIWKEKS